MPLNETLELEPGEYTFVLSDSTNVFKDIVKTVNIVPGDNEDIIFVPDAYTLSDIVLAPVVTVTDSIQKEYNSNTIRHEKDNTERHESNKEATNIYNEEYKSLTDIYLGDEEHPFGEYSIRIER